MKRGFTMLLAEDSKDEVALFSHALDRSSRQTHLNIKLEVAPDGVHAIEYLNGEGRFANRQLHPFPDIIVLDLKMPRMSGLDILRWLKGHPEYARIPKILLSGSSEERDIDEAYRLGVNTYFQKPASLDELRELVHHMICYWAHTQRPLIRHAAA